MIGYSLALQKANRKASKKSLGVRLGRYCIDNGISVIEVTEALGVSRQCVYNWFLGEHEPGLAHAKKIADSFSIL